MAYFEITGLPLRTFSKEFGLTVNLELERGRGLSVLADDGVLPGILCKAITGHGDFSGEIMLNSRRIDPMPVSKRNVSVLGNTPGIIPGRTVKENMELALKERGIDEAEQVFLIEHELSLGLLAGLDEVRAGTLNAIEKTVLALSRILLAGTDLVLIQRLPVIGIESDETVTQFNPGLQLDGLLAVKNLLRRFKATWISVLTDPACVLLLSDNLAVFSQGSLIQEGSIRECLAAPASRLVADFLAFPEMNYRKMRVERDGPYVMLRSGRFGITISEFAKRQIAGREGEEIIIGVRPEDLHIRAYESGDPTVKNLAKVTFIDHIPGGQIVRLDADGVEWLALTETGRVLFTGQLVELRPDPDRVHLFNQINGASLLD